MNLTMELGRYKWRPTPPAGLTIDEVNPGGSFVATGANGQWTIGVEVYDTVTQTYQNGTHTFLLP